MDFSVNKGSRLTFKVGETATLQKNYKKEVKTMPAPEQRQGQGQAQK